MAEPNAPHELESFLRDYIESYEELKALICLRGDHESWRSVGAVASDCKMDEEAIAAALERLAHVGVLARRGEMAALEFRLHDDFRARSALFDRLAAEYRTNTLRLIEIMNRNAIERVRSTALKTFADCFRIRGPHDDR